MIRDSSDRVGLDVASASQRAATTVTAPKVAVVTAAYDVEAFIAETIASVRAQTLADFELIVVDDGSRDRTAEIVAAVRDPRLRLISGSNAGVSVARNRGLDACTAPLVVFLDADDRLTPTALAAMAAALAAHPDAVACFGRHARIDEAGVPLGRGTSALKPLPERDTLRHLIARNIVVNGGTLCIRTAAARATGGYDARLSFGEDWEFWCRLAAHGDFVPLPDQVVLEYRVRRGANSALGGTPFHPNLAAVEMIYGAAAVQRRFPPHELASARRTAEMNVHWSAARNAWIERRRWPFAAFLLAGLLRYPDSVLRWRLVYLFLRSLAPAGHKARA